MTLELYKLQIKRHPILSLKVPQAIDNAPGTDGIIAGFCFPVYSKIGSLTFSILNGGSDVAEHFLAVISVA